MLTLKVLFVLSTIKFASSCNGFSPVIKSSKNCPDNRNPIIKLINSTVKIDENCDVIVSACSEIQPYKTATMVFRVKRNTLTVLETKADLCDNKKKNDMIAIPVASLAIPKQCPVSSSFTYCKNNERVLNLSESTRRLLATFASAAPESVLHVEITHNNGKSCFEVEFMISKSIKKLK